MKNNKHKVQENFQDFIRSTELHQTGEAASKYSYGSNPIGENDLPYEFERRPEIGEIDNSVTMMMERMQSIIEAGINKSNTLSKKGEDVGPYIKRHLAKSYAHLREAYLRMMDM
jgi:methyl-accepting chemotaxis protein